jgi:Ca2+-binding EF-hand superfamily protein
MEFIVYRSELASFLDSLNIHFSKRKWKQVFRHMDRNQKCANRITFEEFYLFIFPHDEEANRTEQDRLRQERET